jgi:hypothetical protein
MGGSRLGVGGVGGAAWESLISSTPPRASFHFFHFVSLYSIIMMPQRPSDKYKLRRYGVVGHPGCEVELAHRISLDDEKEDVCFICGIKKPTAGIGSDLLEPVAGGGARPLKLLCSDCRKRRDDGHGCEGAMSLTEYPYRPLVKCTQPNCCVHDQNWKATAAGEGRVLQTALAGVQSEAEAKTIKLKCGQNSTIKLINTRNAGEVKGRNARAAPSLYPI